MPPELFLSSRNKCQTDVGEKSVVWSLGALLYYIFYRETPKLLEWLEQKDWENEEDLLNVESIPIEPREDVPLKITELIKSCFQIMIFERPSAQEILSQLREIRQEVNQNVNFEENGTEMSPELRKFFSQSKYFS